MTFVLAINLPDRIYLAGDTQISDSVTKEVLGYCMKMTSFADKEHTASISCVYAGNKKFAQYIIGQIGEACQEGRLSMDIFEFTEQITSFLKEVTQREEAYVLTKKLKIIFAGESLTPGALKRWDLGETVTPLLGGNGFRISSPHALTAMQLGIVNCRPQHMFTFVIDDSGAVAQFGIKNENGGVCTVMSAGAKEMPIEEQHELLRFFLYHGAPEKEPAAIVTFLQGKFSETIGGAITLGCIGPQSKIPGHLIHYTHQIDRSDPRVPEMLRWSICHKDGSIYALDPNNNEVDLLAGFWNEDGSASMEL